MISDGNEVDPTLAECVGNSCIGESAQTENAKRYFTDRLILLATIGVRG